MFRKKNTGKKSLVSLCRNGQLDQVRALLQKDPSAINKTDSFGRVPLLIAADAGQLSMVSFRSLLLEDVWKWIISSPDVPKIHFFFLFWVYLPCFGRIVLSGINSPARLRSPLRFAQCCFLYISRI